MQAPWCRLTAVLLLLDPTFHLVAPALHPQTAFAGHHGSSQPTLVFSKCQFGQTARAFNAGWYHGRPWLEHSAKLDLCFCFPKFGANNHKDFVFMKQGFNNWKTALEKDIQQASQCYLKSAVAYSQMEQREVTGETIANLLGPTQT